jgi:hypothetical protein
MYNSTNNSLTTNGTAAFDAIWANTSLREDLFGVILPIDLLTQKPIKQTLFTTWIADINNPFYEFINVK